MTLVLWSLISCALTAAGVAAVKRTARARQWLDRPTDRSSHSAPTPRGGGLALVVVTILTAFAAATVIDVDTHVWFPIAAAGILITVISWIDDLHPLPSWIRFGVHLLAAITIVWFFDGFSGVAVPGIGGLALGATGAVLAVLWIAGLTNAYNFMDGIDGIAGVQAITAGIGWSIAGTLTGVRDLVLVGAIVAAAAVGFLFHNWSPASIFMGDVGSAFLGYLFAAITVAAARRDERLALVGVLLVWPFVFDSGFTLLRRLGRGENITHAHRSHLYQRLVQTGLSHATVAILYGLLDVMGVAAAVAVLKSPPAAVAAYVALAFLAFALWILVLLLEWCTARRN